MPTVESHEHGTPSWVDISAPDLDAAKRFYSELFGWKAEDAGDPEETGGYWMFRQDGKAVAGGGPLQDENHPPMWTTYITVDDLDRTVEEIKEAGGSIAMEPMDVIDAGRMAIASDPSGAFFAMWQAKEHIGAELVNEPVSLCWSELRSRAVEAVKPFYADVFGWGTKTDEHMGDYTVWIRGEDEDADLGGAMQMGDDFPEEVPSHWSVVFAVEDADATANKCRELGGAVTFGPMDSPYGRMVGLVDSSGAPFGAIQMSEEAMAG